MSPTLLILAAGMGSRYGGLKQMDPVGPNGETLMDYSIYDARRAGFGKLVFVIRRNLEAAFRKTLGARFEKHLPVEYVFQELAELPPGFSAPAHRTKPWGTGQAILAAANVIREPFAAINADDFYGANSFRALAGHLRAGGADYAMVGFVLRNTLSDFGSVARGVCGTDQNGWLQTVTERTKLERAGAAASFTDDQALVHRLTGDEIVSMNLWGFTPALFAQLREQFARFLEAHGQHETSEFCIPTVVHTLIQAGQARCRLLRTPDAWFGVTYREDRARVIDRIRALVMNGDYPEKLWT